MCALHILWVYSSKRSRKDVADVMLHRSKPTKRGRTDNLRIETFHRQEYKPQKVAWSVNINYTAKQKVWSLTLSVPCGVSRGVTLFLAVISDAIMIRPDVASVEPDRGLVVSASVLVPSRNALPGWQMIFRYRFLFSYVPVVWRRGQSCSLRSAFSELEFTSVYRDF